MSDLKFELTSNTIQHKGKTLYQIRALKTFHSTSKGELGGWIEKVENLSQDGNAWVYRDAKVYGDALVSNDAVVFGNAQVFGRALVYQDAQVSGDARVFGHAQVSGNTWIYSKNGYKGTMSPLHEVYVNNT